MSHVIKNPPRPSACDESAAAHAWLDGDAIAAIQALLDNCWHLRIQSTLAGAATGKGFARLSGPACEHGD